MFTDRVTLELKAGKGGNGVVAWTRAKYIPKGGPCGGNGGKGGSVILQADTQLFSLDDYRNRRSAEAENGGQGAGRHCSGRNGKDLILKVPCGTVVKDAATGELLRDLTRDGEQWVACKGGRGGLGNDHFKTPTNRAPNFCTPGAEGEIRVVNLELKLIAHVGLVGYPNAGKSTLLSQLAHANVKIGNYPFTTLTPNIGTLQTDDYRRFYIADIPGIIQGAHANRGLGLEFLRHIERTSLLLYVLDGTGLEGHAPGDDLKVLRDELKSYNPELLERPFLVAFNKMDVPEAQENWESFQKEYPFAKETLFAISASDGEGLEVLRAAVIKLLDQF